MNKIFIDHEKLRGAIWGHRRQIAEALGLHETSVSRKISGRQNLTLDELNTIAGVLRRDASDFLYLTDDET